MRTVSVVLTLCVLLCACPALWAQNSPSDDEIFDKVRLRLASDPQVKGGQLEVIVKDGVVTLRGKIETEKLKARAGRLAHKVKGVKSVVNELVVKP